MIKKQSPVLIPTALTVKELADKLGVKVTEVITVLMKNGVMATINDTVDFAAAHQAAAQLGIRIKEQAKPQGLTITKQAQAEGLGQLGQRPPIVAMMGHIDHGKTTLLDRIRKTSVVATEAGGITQHLSAYQIKHGGRIITFLDTPGHEAFSVLREHGAHLTDLAIIVVAADEGIKPQTKEAIKFAQKAGVKMIVAINKIDKPEANSQRVRKALSELGLVPDDWGGETVMVDTSAKTGVGVKKLLDLVLLVADIEELKAKVDGPAEGIVIEAHMAKGLGPVATLLVEQGQLETGNYLVAGSTYAKVRVMKDSDGKEVKQATPATPVVVAGWKTLPEIGNQFETIDNEKAARSQAAQQTAVGKVATPAQQKLEAAMAASRVKQLPIVIKADVNGSLESIARSLDSINTDEVQAKIIWQAVGPINESDINLAQSAGAQIIGFNVTMPMHIKKVAQRAQVPVRLYRVIYELLDDIKADLTKLLEPEVVEETVAKLEIKGVFRTTKHNVICGGSVIDGKIAAGLYVRLRHNDEVTEIGSVASVQKQQRDVKEAVAGDICGLNIKTKDKVTIAIGDELELFTRETKTRTL